MTATPPALLPDAETIVSLVAPSDEGLDLATAIWARHEVVMASGGEITCSMEPVDGMDSLREGVPDRWRIALSGEQARMLGQPLEGCGSTLEAEGWDPQGLETFWVLDYMLFMASRDGVAHEDLDAFREEVTDALRFLDTHTEIVFEPMEGGRFTVTCPAIEDRLGWDDSWRVAMPSLASTA